MTKPLNQLLTDLTEAAGRVSKSKRYVERVDWDDGSTTWEIHTKGGFVAFSTHNYEEPMRAKMDADLFALCSSQNTLRIVEALRVAREALKFYADSYNWTSNSGKIGVTPIWTEDHEHDTSTSRMYGGKRARSTLTKMEEG